MTIVRLIEENIQKPNIFFYNDRSSPFIKVGVTIMIIDYAMIMISPYFLIDYIALLKYNTKKKFRFFVVAYVFD